MRGGDSIRVRFTVDGAERRVEGDPEMPLLWILRDRLGLTSAKYGCGLGVCGACSVLEGRRTVRSCRITLSELGGRSFTTLAGLSPAGELHPVQRAWLEEDVSQCGFCQAGPILEAVALLARNPRPTETEIDLALSSILCRCGTYVRIRKAVRRAARLLAASPEGD